MALRINYPIFRLIGNEIYFIDIWSKQNNAKS